MIGKEGATRPVHLVGSIPLESAGDVFDLVGAELSGCCSRIPDGETGERKNWIGWQLAVFAGQEALTQSDKKDREYQLHPPFTFKPEQGPADLDFSNLGFAQEALSSFALFKEKQIEGVLPAGAKFMVAIPTPFAPVYSFTAYAIQDRVFPLYEAAILSEMQQICGAIPHDRLSIQWDVATEMSIFEQVYSAPLDDPWAELIGRLAKLGGAVPAGVDMGYHLCYGSMNNKHWKEPDDLGMCVKVINALADQVSRPINFIHMPVPIERDDHSYYAPLQDLELDQRTELFLGLVHDADDLDGNARRMAAASQVVEKYGIGAECGFGRQLPEEMAPLIALHRQLAAR